MPRHQHALVVSAVLAVMAPSALCVSTYTCTVVPIPGLTSPITGIFPRSINNQEQVAGTVGGRAFVIDNTGASVPYAQPPNATVIVDALNNNGQVAGWTGDIRSPWYPIPNSGLQPAASFISNADQSLTLFDPPPDTPSQSYGEIRVSSLNDNGDTLGEISVFEQDPTSPAQYWFIRNAAGIYTIFGRHPGPGRNVSFFGNIVTLPTGSLNNARTALLDNTVRYADGTEKPIGNPGGVGFPWVWSGINNKGYIAGNFTRFPYTFPFSVVLSPDGNAPVAACPESDLNPVAAFSVNDNGVVAATQFFSMGVVLIRPTGYKSGADLPNRTWGFSPSPVGVQGGTGRIYLTSNGSADLRVQNIAVGGRDANDSPGDFTVTQDGTTCVDITDIGGGTLVQSAKTFTPGQFCSVSFSFTPRGVGSRRAQLVIFDDAPDAPHIIRLDGTGLGKSNLVFSNNYWDFGRQAVGQTTAPATLYVYNPGTDVINISSLTFSGQNASDFHVAENACGSAISPYTTCIVRFAFSPAVAGFKNAVLVLTDDSPVRRITIPISGFAY
jgi:hypothetical protein